MTIIRAKTGARFEHVASQGVLVRGHVAEAHRQHRALGPESFDHGRVREQVPAPTDQRVGRRTDGGGERPAPDQPDGRVCHPGQALEIGPVGVD